ncbi:MAG: tRNA pseudouridine(55) synthase TruB [Collinsella sp.]
MFGAETTTDDAEGEVTRTAPMSDDLLSPMFAKQLLADFVGELDQVPPAFSAISVDGVRSYKRARAGEDVELPARTIEVYSADLVSIDEVDGHAVWTASFDVSKGTYIRALARDIGRAAGNAAHIVDLRRTASGPVGIGSCLHVEDLDKELARASALDPASVLGYPRASCPTQSLPTCSTARPSLAPHATRRAASRFFHGGQLRAIGLVEGGRVRMETVFPQGVEGARR